MIMWPKDENREVIKFGSRSLRGFRVAASSLMVRESPGSQ